MIIKQLIEVEDLKEILKLGIDFKGKMALV